MAIRLFFGLGVGRCGTMSLANLLNSEPEALCLHEGKIRNREASGEKLLPFLTLQNGAAYAHPDRAEALFARAREHMPVIAKESGAGFLGDVAYNYAPFLPAIATMFPDARVFAIFRNGRDFVQSATTVSAVDETPVGWAPNGKSLPDVERFIAMGRWRPRPGERWATEWDDSFDHFEKNAWLWAETNRVILDTLTVLDPAHLMIIRFEDFFARLKEGYGELRNFLGFRETISDETRRLIEDRPINHRSVPAVGKPESWTAEMHERFDAIAGETMHRLMYS